MDDRVAQRHRRRYRYHGVLIPALRVGLAVGMLVPVGLHQVVLQGGLQPAKLALVAGVTVGYAVVVLLVLNLAYRRPRSEFLGNAFLFVDMFLMFAPQIWATGGAASWIFFAPAARVVDRLYQPPILTAALAHLAPLSFVAAVGASVVLDGATPSWAEVAVKAVFLYLLALYAIFVGRESYEYRRRLRAAVSRARSLSEELEAKNGQLATHAEKTEALAALKGTFLANVSHEIRTPLNGIIGMTAVLDQTDLDPGQLESVRIIRSSSDTLLSLVNDVLDFSKVESGQLVLEHRPFSLPGCLQSAVDPLMRAAQDKGLTLQVRVDDALPDYFVGDETRLRQVLVNLVGNAVKFTAAGSVTLEARPGPGGDGLHLSVTDTGVGIAPDRLAKLYEPFVQADASTTRRFGGTGLGLTITRHLVEAMGGEVEVESELGRGARFDVVVPLPEAVAFVPTPVGGVSQPLPRTADLRILVVDDNAVNRKVAVRLLETLGFVADVAEDGEAAVQAVLEQRYDLVLMDVLMPKLDGHAATRRIRTLRPGGGPHIVAMTANAMRGDRELALAAGMDDYVAKPLRKIDLRRILVSVPELARQEG